MMQVIIPMSGFGERFRRAGYDIPKPLIEVNGRPIIGHVVDMFPGVSDIVFVCNRDHIENPSFAMEKTLRAICPGARFAVIDPHKLGPVHAVLAAAHLIDPGRPTVINYCDFTCYWDFDHFCRFTEQSRCDGAIPAYTGFHPHMLRSTNFAYVRQTEGWVEDIQEKQPYTDTPMNEYASSGTYYFRTGAIAIDYCRRTMAEGIRVNGEFYASLVYKPMLRDKLGIAVYPLQHFMQWGTPEDLDEFNCWSRFFERLAGDPAKPPAQAGAVMVPMAGAGSRFANEGFADPKPLIPVSGLPMVVQATRDLPQAPSRVFVLRADLPKLDAITATLTKAFPGAHLKILERLTEGGAVTCLMALDQVDAEAPLTIGACDNGVLYDAAHFTALMGDKNVDVIVWVMRRYPNAARRPQMYGWVATEGERVTGVSVKVPLADPANDPVIIGAFTFKRARDFRAAAERMVARGGSANGEFHVDGCITDALALRLKVVTMDVDAYLCWGTPDELRTFAYWQSCFHKWPRHRYRLEGDARVASAARAELQRAYAATVPPLPGKRR